MLWHDFIPTSINNKMKREFIKKLFKPVALAVLTSMLLSACSVTYREQHRRRPPPPPEEKVIIKP